MAFKTKNRLSNANQLRQEEAQLQRRELQKKKMLRKQRLSNRAMSVEMSQTKTFMQKSMARTMFMNEMRMTAQSKSPMRATNADAFSKGINLNTSIMDRDTDHAADLHFRPKLELDSNSAISESESESDDSDNLFWFIN